jgi:hypothetical protein
MEYVLTLYEIFTRYDWSIYGFGSISVLSSFVTYIRSELSSTQTINKFLIDGSRMEALRKIHSSLIRLS